LRRSLRGRQPADQPGHCDSGGREYPSSGPRRIGYLGNFNDLMLAGTLGGVEMGLVPEGVPHESGRRARGARIARERRARRSGAATVTL